jgi:arylsulfatase A-like enzyme
LLWYCSDNGGAAGPKSTGNLRGSKGTLWDGGLRVPGIVEWPARITRPFISEMPCSTLDMYPTILEATGAAATNQIQPLDGISLLPLFDGRMKSRSKPIPFWANVRSHNSHSALLDWPYKLHSNPAAPRNQKAKKAGNPLPEMLLYDVSKDPKETTDLTAMEPERVRTMTATLEAWKASVEKSFAGADYSAAPGK